ncbi:hypothetical protein CX676_15430 [Paracoccus zhejiangensis]|uniref:HTH luxR-type domain-containing protein n=2 Tax=Paracoccus zhejiangensis TaxID=1077935 RepID=A0A2H5F1G1_9RHOB|nr:hypothetical protein CX676_15430 [Paracoccus zhejiangensis]
MTSPPPSAAWPTGKMTMNLVSYDDESFASASPLPISAAEVMFVGNQCNFSGSLIAATSQELGQITSAVLHSFAEFQKFVTQTGLVPTLVILDEPTIRNLSESDRGFLLGLDGLSLGIAFSSLVYGADFYSNNNFKANTVSIFPLNVRLDIWLSIIKLIAHGGSYVSPEVSAHREVAAPPAPSGESGLTQRQLDVLQLVADGQSNKRIAAKLGLSIHTVKLHLHNASLRLGARNRTEAAMRYRSLKS